MKKEYIKPTMKVVEIKTSCLLNDSLVINSNAYTDEEAW